MTRGTIAAIAVVLAASSAYANPTADAAYQEGRRLYDIQEWDQAIAKFKEAYKLRADAPSLFNIAQSYRLKGDCAQAASFYKTFKRNYPKERNVDKFIAEMEACAKTGVKPVEPAKTEPAKTEPAKTEPAKTEPAKTEPAKTEPVETKADPITTASIDPTISPDPVAPVDQGPSNPGSGKRIAGIAIAGGGVVMLGAGVVFALRARSAATDAESLPAGSMWQPGIEERGEKASKNAKLFGGIGLAAVVGGTVLYMVSRNSGSEQSTSVSVVPTHDGATFSYAGSF